MSTSLGGYRGINPQSGAASGLRGTGYKQVSMPTLSPEQMQLFQMLHGSATPGIQGGISQLSQLAQGGSDELWNQLEAPAMRQFGQMQGDIASRFSGAGMGGRRSSGFHNALKDASTDLAERLQSNRMGLQQQAIRDLLGIGQTLLGTQTQENMLVPKRKKWWEELLPALAGGVGQGLGTLPALL